MEGKKKPENGTFTQVPNVFLDTCDLPESAQILYLRLLRHYGHRGGTFTGSIRKLSNLVRLSKSTVDRMIKILRDSHLIGLDYGPGADSEREVMIVVINTDELWALNKHHYEVTAVPNWDKVMPGIPEVSQIGTKCPELGQDELNLGQQSTKLGQSVPGSSSNEDPILTNTEKKERRKENDSLSQSFTLSSDSLEKVRDFAEFFGDTDITSCQEEAERIFQESGVEEGIFYDRLFHAHGVMGKKKRNMEEFLKQLRRVLTH